MFPLGAHGKAPHSAPPVSFIKRRHYTLKSHPDLPPPFDYEGHTNINKEAVPVWSIRPHRDKCGEGENSGLG